MGNREDDLNPNQWIGFQFPLTYNPDTTGYSDVKDENPDSPTFGQYTYQEAGFFPRTQTIREQASYNIRNLLQTIPGERLAVPLYGSKLHHLLFEPMDEELYVKIEDEIRSSIKKWLGYIVIKRIDILASEHYTNYINVSIDFSLSSDLDTIQKVDLRFEDFDQIASSNKLG